MNDQPSILVVDDDEGIRRTLEMILAKKNYQPVTAPDGKTALALAEERFFNLALLDIRLPDTTGTDLLAQLKTRHPDLEVLIITGHATLETAIQALSHGAYHYFIKPLNVDELLVTLEKALDKQRLVIENRELLAAVQKELEERTRAEEALRRRERDFVNLAENAVDIIARFDVNLRHLYCNSAVEREFGLPVESVIGKTPFELGMPRESAEIAEVALRATLKTRQEQIVEQSIPTPQGTKCYQTRIVPEFDAAGKIESMLAITRDITERKRIEEAVEAERNLLRTVLDNLPDHVYVKDTQFRYILNNPAHLRALGAATEEETIGKTYSDYGPADLAAQYLNDDRQVLQTGSVLREREVLQPLPSGEKAWVLVNKVPLRDKQGEIIGLVGVSRDITERKRAEEALEAERNLLRTLIDNLPDRIYIKDAASRFLLNNPAHLQALGAQSQEQVIGKTDMDLRPVEMAERYMADDLQVLESGESLLNREEPTVLLNGERGWLLTTKVPLRDPQSNVSGLVGISRDITTRKRAEEALRESEATLQSIFRAAPTGIGLVSNRVLMQVNQRICEMTGRSQEELIGQSARILYPSDQDYEYVGTEKYRQIQERRVGTLETRWQHKDGTVIDVLMSSVPLDLSDLTKGVTFTTLDITARKRAEEALRESEERFRSLFENVLDGVYRSTSDGQLLAANPALAHMLGYTSVEELLSIDIAAVLYADPVKRALWAAQLLQTEEIRNVETTLKRKDSRSIVVLDNARVVRDAQGNALYFEGTLTDITERKQHERELLAVATVSAALRTAPTRSEMLPVILDQAQTFLNADAASIITRDPATGDAMVEVGCGIWSGGPEFRVPCGKGISGRVFETARPYVTNDLHNDSHYYWPDQISYLTAMAMVPLIVQGIVVGALAIGRVTPIASAELSVLTAIADITANALHRAALHEKTKQHLQYLVALRTVDQTINASLDLRFTLNILLDQIVTQLRVDAADILLHNSAFQTLDYAAGRGFRTKGVERRSVRFGEGNAGAVALERRVVRVRNLAQSTERESAPALAGEGFVSYCGVPLIAKGKIKGVLEVFQRTPLDVDSEWLNFFEMLAEQAAIAIDNAQLFEDLQRAHSNLVQSYDATIEGWSRALDLRDQATEWHAQRVLGLTEQLARATGVDETDLIHIRRGALLHDIGKIGVPDHILRKPAALTEEEWVIMRRHPEFAHDLLKPIPYLHAALDIPFCHHEKWDGTGYPRGLKGEAIPMSARIFALVDVWDALCSERPYRAAWSEEQARDYMRQQAGKHFDPKLVERFMKIVR